MYYYTRKEFENCVKIFINSTDFMFNLLRENIYLSTKKINSLAETLLYNKDTLDEMTIDEIIKDDSLIDEKTGNLLRNTISSNLGVKFIKENSYRSVIFTFKYSAIKNFFYGQYRKFLPEYDFDQINASKKTKAFFDATMKELDRVDDAISKMSNAVDINEIPYNYLEYIAYLIGYQSEDKNLVKDYVFRDLIKNMIEVYKIKGTNYSFELFLTFLGFDVTIKEYWFDRRFYYKTEDALNEYTKATKKDRNKFIFYLSPESPEKYIPTELTNQFTVFKNEIKGTMDLNMFNRYLNAVDKDGHRIYDYKVEQLLGFEPGFDNPYTYFKTNIVDFNFTSFKRENEQEISEDDIKIINKIFNFLLPIFIKRQFVITINNWEENVNPDPDLNEDWVNSFFLFTDKYNTDKTIDISYEECKGFDPIYERVRRWDADSIYNKGSIVIYDNSIDYEFYKEIDFGNIVRYNEKNYIYIGSSQYMIWNPENDIDNYVLLPNPIPVWRNGMEINNKDVVRYNSSCYVYVGQEKISEKEPSKDSDFLDVGLINGDYPSYYECTELLNAYNKYDYVEVGESEDPETGKMVSSYVWSRIDYNTDDFDNIYTENNPNGTWYEFGEKSIEDFRVSTYNLIYGRIYRFNSRLYVYEGPLKPSYINPINDSNFKLLTEKANNKELPDESDIWKKIDFNNNKEDFSVLDRLILDEELSEKQALKKISKMFDSVCVTSEKFDKWSNLKGKYIYLDFEGNENYEQGAEPIECIDCDDPETTFPFTLEQNQVLKHKYTKQGEEEEKIYYLYCYNATTVSNTEAIENVIDNNNSQYTALIENNWATTNYNPDFKMYVPVNYKTIRIDFTSDNPDFGSVCADIENKLNSLNIIGENGNYIFEKSGDYFKIYSKLDAEFEEQPYIKIQYDFIKDIDTIPYVDENGDVTNSFYGVDPNNAYKIFPDYFTSPRYRYDFGNRSFTQQVFEFANRRNYITEFYPSTKFALNRILRREVFNPVFDDFNIDNLHYNLSDDFTEEKRFPKLDNNFFFKDNKQKCFEEYYKEKGYKDYNIDKVLDNKICILVSKATSCFYSGEKVFINILTNDNHSYFYNTTIESIIKTTNDDKNYYQITLNGSVDLTDFTSGILRKFDKKIYTIEDVNNGEIKIPIIDNQNQPFIVKPEENHTFETYKDFKEYSGEFINGDIVKVKRDENYFNKPTYWKFQNNNWIFIYYLTIEIYVETSNGFIQKECDVLTSEIIDGSDFGDYYNIITISNPEILNDFVSGKITLNKNVWHLKDCYEFMNEYLLTGRTVYDWKYRVKLVYHGVDEHGKDIVTPENKGLIFDGSQKF